AFAGVGAPAEFNLIELGPGRGTLMKDVLRAGRVVPEFVRSARIHLVETSPVLRNIQREAVGSRAVWHSDLDKLPQGPSIFLANEFFDAIPIRQFEFHDGKWMERMIGLGPEARLTIGLVQSRHSFERRI